MSPPIGFLEETDWYLWKLSPLENCLCGNSSLQSKLGNQALTAKLRCFVVPCV